MSNNDVDRYAGDYSDSRLINKVKNVAKSAGLGVTP